MTRESDEDARFRRAEAALSEYLLRAEAPDPIAFEDWCAARPEIANELRQLHAECLELEQDRGLGTVTDPESTPDEMSPQGLARGALPDDDLPSPESLLHRLKEPRTGTSGYAVLGQIGRGGMGEVLSVRDLVLRRELAMKIVRDASPSSAEERRGSRRLARFLEEAQIMAQLDHPGIVPVHELGLDDHGRPFFTMKRVRGRTLSEVFELVLDGTQGWTLARALTTLQRVCDALAYAHEQGVVHRDLKPSNVMVGEFGEVFVMDWGLARVLGRPDPAATALGAEPDGSPEHAPGSLRTDRSDRRGETPDATGYTRHGQGLGTPQYMPPEQAEGRWQDVGVRADVYALGAMLYDLLAGHAPYMDQGECADASELQRRVIAGPPTALRRLAREAPAELVGICEKAMARDPADRYARVRDFASDLQAYQDNRKGTAWRDGPGTWMVKSVRRHPQAAILAVCGVLVVALGFGLRSQSIVAASKSEALADVDLQEDLERVRDRGVEFVRGSSVRDNTGWAEAYVQVLAPLGLEAGEDGAEQRFVAHWRRMRERSPTAAAGVLRALHELEGRLLAAGAHMAWQRANALPVATGAHLKAATRQQVLDSAAQLEREHPRLVQLFGLLPTLVHQLEENPWRRSVHEAVLEFWRSDRQLPSDLGANDEQRTGPDLTWLGLALLQCADPRAAEVIERAAELDRGSFDAHFQLGRILLNRIFQLREEHRADVTLSRRAVRECEYANVLNPRSAWALTNLGESLVQLAIDCGNTGTAPRGEQDKDSQAEFLKQRAERCFREAIRANGQAAPAAVGACINLVNLIGYWNPESEGLIDLALQLEPCSKAALIAKAAWYEQLKQLDQLERLDCEMEYRMRAVCCHPYDAVLLEDTAFVLHARATVLREHGDETRASLGFDEACAVLSQSLRLESSDPRSLGRLSILEVDAGQLQAAFTHFETYIARLMTDPDRKEDRVSLSARLEAARDLLGHGRDCTARFQASDPELGRRWQSELDTLKGIIEELRTRVEEAALK